jgi:hypothetical protein
MTFLDKLFPKKVLPGRLLEEEGFVDVDLPIVEISSDHTGECRFTVRGEIAGTDVGFSFVLHPAWDPQPIEGGGAIFYWGTGSYERTGPESDRFVALVAQRYQLDATSGSASMLPRIQVQVVGLDSDPSKASGQGAKMKLFFHSESEDEGRYAEVFTNINIEEGVLEFHEKDNEYRAPLIRALREA